MDSASSTRLNLWQGLADKLGVFAAAACAVHCLAAPLILAFAPLVGGIWTSPRTHWVFAAVSIPAALSLLWRKLSGSSRRLRVVLGSLACVGSALIVLGLAAPGASWSQNLGVEVALPSWMPGDPGNGHPATCQDECCASVIAGEDGAGQLFVPIASLVTMLGGLLIVTAHVTALRRTGCNAACSAPFAAR